MAQVGGLFVLSRLMKPKRYSTYFLKIDNVKFPPTRWSPVDTLIFRVELTSEIRRGIADHAGAGFFIGGQGGVGGRLHGANHQEQVMKLEIDNMNRKLMTTVSSLAFVHPRGPFPGR